MSSMPVLGSLPRLLRLPLNILAPEGRLPAPFEARRSIFVHIPKAAGSSVSLALFGCQVGHIPIADLYASNYLATRRCFKFTFVRHPLDRLHSAFQFLKRGGINDNDKAFAAAHLGDIDFAAFVERLETDPALLQWWHFRPQQSFLCDPARPRKVLVDFVGRYETLERDFSAVCDRMGLTVTLPNTNSTVGRTGIDTIDAQTVARVRRIYARDYELFGYD